MRRPISVLLIAPAPPPVGGIARWTEGILRYSARREDVFITHLDSAVRGRGVHDVRIWVRVKTGIAHTREMRRSLSRILGAANPEVVHLTTSGSMGTLRDLLLIRKCQRVKVPVVYHLRFGRLPAVLREPSWERWLLRAAINRAEVTLVLDERSRKAVEGDTLGATCAILPNPLSEDWYVRTGENSRADETQEPTPFVLFAGHVTAAKGVTDLLEAWSSIPRNGWQLVLAGAVKYPYPRDVIAKYHLEDSVQMLGEVTSRELRRLMEKCQIFVLPSHTEGFPNSVLEAMGTACAIVATDVGAVPDMLAPNAGTVVAAGDINGLAMAISGLMSSDEERKLLGQRARLKALSEYSMARVFDGYVSLWAAASARQIARGDK